jgi:hypothetical protein
MSLKEKVENKIETIENDSRMKYPPAKVTTNAPLALQQTAMESKLQVLKWILNELENK